MSTRATEIVSIARELLETGGWAAVTMRAVADRIGIRAPSLYKHVPDKDALRALLVERGLAEIGAALYAALEPGRSVGALLAAYRAQAVAHPAMYRLGTQGRMPRDRIAPGLEEWSGAPFFLVAGDPNVAQALWAFAHGMVILEIDHRFPDESELDRSWAAGADAFAGQAATE